MPLSAQLVDDQKCSTPTDDPSITTDKQKKKLEKELKSKQKEIAKAEKKEKEKEEKEERRKEKEEKKKEKAEKNQKARSNMKANSVQGQPVMEDFRLEILQKLNFQNQTSERVTTTQFQSSCPGASITLSLRVSSLRDSTGRQTLMLTPFVHFIFSISLSILISLFFFFTDFDDPVLFLILTFTLMSIIQST